MAPPRPTHPKKTKTTKKKTKRQRGTLTKPTTTTPSDQDAENSARGEALGPHGWRRHPTTATAPTPAATPTFVDDVLS
eukprot:1783247-Pyramimonas_sp.AAC.1